jgi:CRP/FNR family cyclic AMP-dependent transcriptional regulator
LVGETALARKGSPLKVRGVITKDATIREVPAGGVIFAEGDDGEEMFGVVEGEVEVRTHNGHTTRLGPDDTFGELAIVDSAPRSATATAVVDTKLAVIDRRRFLFLVHETPMFALQVMSNLGERLRAND